MYYCDGKLNVKIFLSGSEDEYTKIELTTKKTNLLRVEFGVTKVKRRRMRSWAEKN